MSNEETIMTTFGQNAAKFCYRLAKFGEILAKFAKFCLNTVKILYTEMPLKHYMQSYEKNIKL